MLFNHELQFAVQVVEGDWEMNELEHLQREISIWQVCNHCLCMLSILTML